MIPARKCCSEGELLSKSEPPVSLGADLFSSYHKKRACAPQTRFGDYPYIIKSASGGFNYPLTEKLELRLIARLREKKPTSIRRPMCGSLYCKGFLS